MSSAHCLRREDHWVLFTKENKAFLRDCGRAAVPAHLRCARDRFLEVP